MELTANPYILVGINGFASGLGVIVAQHFYEVLIRPRVNKAVDRVNHLKMKTLTKTKAR